MWAVVAIVGVIVMIGLVMAYGLTILFAVFTAYMGYIGMSETGTTSEFMKLFGALIGFFIGLGMGKSLRRMFVGDFD